MKTRKTNDPNFARIIGSQLIINTNDEAFVSYIGERDKTIKLQKTIGEVDALKKELSEFKQAVALLLNQQNIETK